MDGRLKIKFTDAEMGGAGLLLTYLTTNTPQAHPTPGEYLFPPLGGDRGLPIRLQRDSEPDLQKSRMLCSITMAFAKSELCHPEGVAPSAS